MINKTLHHRSILALFISVATLCVLFYGMRVPDLSQPNRRPKPKARAYIEQQFKKVTEASAKNAAKKSLDHVEAEPPPLAAPAVLVAYRTERLAAAQSTEVYSFFPNLSRAPPGLTA